MTFHDSSSLTHCWSALLNIPFFSSFSKTTTLGLFTTLFLGYLVLVRCLRYYWLNRTLREYYESRRKRGAKPDDPMTEEEAHAIHLRFHQYEFPWIALVSLEFALYKTYGVPTGSYILVKTTQLSCPITSPKRYADTSVLVNEWVHFGPNHPRYHLAISRMNYLHSRYGSRVSNRDLLYVLGVFILEPVKWAENYEYRKVCEEEKEAFYIFWKGVGEKMGIEGIPEPDKEKGISGFDMYDRWCEDHEENYMKFSPDNKAVSDETTHLLLYYFPEWTKYERIEKDGKATQGIIRQALATFMYPRLIDAVGIPLTPKPWLYVVCSFLMAARKLFVRYFMLPRFKPWHRIATTDPNRSPYDIQYQHWNSYKVEPWYIQPSLINKYISPWNWYAYFFLRKLAGRDDIPLIGERDEQGNLKYGGEGYYLDNLGPKKWDGKGRDEVREKAERMMAEFQEKIPKEQRIVVGCPFGGFGRGRGEGVEELGLPK